MLARIERDRRHARHPDRHRRARGRRQPAPADPVTPHGDDEGRDRAQAAFDAIIDAAIELGGTVTGEHGVGLLKRAGMQRELGPVVLAMQRAIKDALDPQGILNPGKVVG